MDNYRPIQFAPYRGLDLEKPSIVLGPESAVASRNFLFEDGVAFPRPGVAPKADGAFLNFAGVETEYMVGYELDNGVVHRLRINAQGNMVTYPGTFAVVSGVAFGDKEFHNTEIVNGQVAVGNIPGGLYYYTPPNTGPTQVTAAKYRYVTGFLSRLVGANWIESGLENPRKVGWSTAGNISDWASDGAGSVSLTDISDDITGLKSFSNVLIIARRHGFTFGYSTEQSTPAIRFENVTKFGVGCPYPSTIQVFDNQLFFVGYRNVYAMTLQGVEPIGTPIRKDLIREMSGGTQYQGLIVQQTLDAPSSSTVREAVPRLRYHLIPLDKPDGRHFCYDFQDKTWSSHRYESPVLAAYVYSFVERNFSLAMQLDELTHIWDLQTPLESGQVAFLKSGDAIVEPKTHAAKVQYIVFAWRYLKRMATDKPWFRITVTGKQDHHITKTSFRVDPTNLSADPGEWFLSRARAELVGQIFNVEIECAGGHVEFGPIELHTSDNGKAIATIGEKNN